MDVSGPVAIRVPVAPAVRGLLDAYDVPSCIVDAERVVLAVNSAARATDGPDALGLRLIEGRAWSELCLETGAETAPEMATLLERLQRNGAETLTLDYVIRAPGRFKSFRLTAKAISGGDGGMLVTHTDITKALTTERRLLETEQRMGDLAGLFDEWLWSTDDGLRLIELRAPSDSVGRRIQPHLVGRSLDEILGAAEPQAEGAGANVRRRRPFRQAIVPLDLDGTRHFIRLSGKPAFAEDGAFEGYIGVAEDITEALAVERSKEAAERRYREIVEFWSDWFWETDAEHRFVYRSETLNGRTQLDESRLLGKRRSELIDLELTDKEQLARHLDDLENHRPFRDFVYGCRNLGHVRYLKIGGKPRFDADGRFTGYVGNASDVTAVVTADAERASAERRLKAAIDQLPSGVAIWDRDDRLVTCNDQYWNGLATPPAIGCTFEQAARIVRGGSMATGDAEFEAAIRARVELHRNPGGPVETAAPNDRIVQVNERRMDDGSIVSVTTDITSIKARERLLAEQRGLLQTTLDHISDGILAVDEDWRITAANDTFSHLLGLPEEMAKVGVHFASLLEWLARRGDYGPGSAQAEAGRIFEAMAGRARWYDERPVPNGRLIAWRVRRMQGGGRILAVADISEQREAEQRREQLRSAMAQAEKLEAVAQLAGGLAHDLNNTLLPIIALTEVALDDLPAGSQPRADLEKVVTAAEHARGLVQRLMTFSRAESERSAAPLDPGVEDALALVMAAAGANITMKVELDAKDISVPLGITEIQQIVTNLGLNAAQAIGERPGTVVVSTVLLDADEDRLRASPGHDSARRYARLTVADDGPGISPDVLPRIFEPFFTTKEVGKGTGLGLAVVHGLVGRAGGWIEARSDNGAQFDVFLPVAEAIVEFDEFMEGSGGTYSSD
jgi:PAS domain S-box-containing protein